MMLFVPSGSLTKHFPAETRSTTHHHHQPTHQALRHPDILPRPSPNSFSSTPQPPQPPQPPRVGSQLATSPRPDYGPTGTMPGAMMSPRPKAHTTPPTPSTYTAPSPGWQPNKPFTSPGPGKQAVPQPYRQDMPSLSLSGQASTGRPDHGTSQQSAIGSCMSRGKPQQSPGRVPPSTQQTTPSRSTASSAGTYSNTKSVSAYGDFKTPFFSPRSPRDPSPAQRQASKSPGRSAVDRLKNLFHVSRS
jgi:hypothetical protein